MSNKKKVPFLILGIIFVLTMALLAVYSSWDYGNYTRYNTTQMAMYNFNEGTGTTTHDDSGRNKTGTLYGNTYWAQEKDLNLTQNAALYFDGSGDYVKVAHNNEFNISSADVNGFVFSAMIKIPSTCTKSYMMICSKYDFTSGPPAAATGFTFYLTYGKLRFTAYNGTSQANVQDSLGADLRDGQWHFVAVEYLNGVYRLFIDPTETYSGQVYSISSSVQPANNTKNFCIGHREHPLGWDNDKDFQGTIDCVYFYEIEPESELNPPHRMWGFNNEGYWSFDEGNGTPNGIVNDLVRWTSYNSGYHNYGKIYGTGFNFLPRICAWKGEHAAEFNNIHDLAYVEVPDPTNRLDFTAYPGAEDLYIEFLFMPNNFSAYQYIPLVAKFDPSPANGYQIYAAIDVTEDPNNLRGTLNFEVARLGFVRKVSISPISFNGGWMHVWAWAQNGVLHLTLRDETNGISWPVYTQGCGGIGASTSSLYFGAKFGYLFYAYFDGWMDEVVIGRCMPGLEY